MGHPVCRRFMMGVVGFKRCWRGRDGGCDEYYYYGGDPREGRGWYLHKTEAKEKKGLTEV